MHPSGRRTTARAPRIAAVCIVLLAPLPFALPASAAATAAAYTITDLGTLGTGTPASPTRSTTPVWSSATPT